MNLLTLFLAEAADALNAQRHGRRMRTAGDRNPAAPEREAAVAAAAGRRKVSQAEAAANRDVMGGTPRRNRGVGNPVGSGLVAGSF